MPRSSAVDSQTSKGRRRPHSGDACLSYILPAFHDFVVLETSVSIVRFFRQALSSGGFSLLETECCIDVFPVPHFCTDLISCFLIVRLLPGSITILLSLPPPLFLIVFPRRCCLVRPVSFFFPPPAASSRCILCSPRRSPLHVFSFLFAPFRSILFFGAPSLTLLPFSLSLLPLFSSCVLLLLACCSFSCMISRRRR